VVTAWATSQGLRVLDEGCRVELGDARARHDGRWRPALRTRTGDDEHGDGVNDGVFPVPVATIQPTSA
jgi:hypothetical protein